MDKVNVGIWGLGIVGKAAFDYFYLQNYQITILDKTPLSPEDQLFFARTKVTFLLQDTPATITRFLEQNDYVLASPGIDLRPYQQYSHKWITELDIIQDNFNKPLIAVTGSLGKTSTVHLLSQHMQTTPLRVYTGGNIGHGMLSLLINKQMFDIALLEVSSFQLEQCKRIAPTLAIWTTFHPNHLDRHTSLQEYFNAKKKILIYQKHQEHALLPFSLIPYFTADELNRTNLHFFSLERPTDNELTMLSHPISLFYTHNDTIMHEYNGTRKELLHISQLPPLTFQENWLIMVSASHIMDTYLALPYNPTLLAQHAHCWHLPEHRLEPVVTFNNSIFYNDSKSTTPASTQAALERFSGKPIRLFLGGLSKGIDRTPLIKRLPANIKAVYCFGKEAEILAALCKKHAIPACAYISLDEAFQACTEQLQPGEYILFSPSGSSFDLFKNFEARGTYFKKLVRTFVDSHTK